jgi:hypothetical protein
VVRDTGPIRVDRSSQRGCVADRLHTPALFDRQPRPRHPCAYIDTHTPSIPHRDSDSTR